MKTKLKLLITFVVITTTWSLQYTTTIAKESSMLWMGSDGSTSKNCVLGEETIKEDFFTEEAARKRLEELRKSPLNKEFELFKIRKEKTSV